MFDPYHKWLGIPKDQRPPTYYQLLGISPEETDPEVIAEAALRQTSHVRTYQAGPHAQSCTDLLNEIAQAKNTLLNPAKRREYDAKLPRANPLPTPPVPANTPAPTAVSWQGTPLATLCDTLLRNRLFSGDHLQRILAQWTTEAAEPGNLERFRQWLVQQGHLAEPQIGRPPTVTQRQGGIGAETEGAMGPAPPTLPPSLFEDEPLPGSASPTTPETDLVFARPWRRLRAFPKRHGLTGRDGVAFILGVLTTLAIGVVVKVIQRLVQP